MEPLFIPIDTENPSQRVSVTLDGHKLSIWTHWQVNNAQWYIDLDCDAVGLHAHGFALVSGLDFLANRTLGQLGALILVDLQGNDDPDFEGLGLRWKLTYISVEDLAAI